MQRALSLICVGFTAASAATASASPDSTGPAATAVQINGWFHCSASTLYATADSDNYHDDAYFLETSRAAKATPSAKQPRGVNHRTTKHRSRAVSPRVASIEHGGPDAALWGASFLREPLAFAQSHANWRAHQATPPPHGRHSVINKQHEKDTKTKKKKEGGEEKKTGENDDGENDDESKESSFVPHYECAEFRVPFCYDGICESNRTLDVFVKRAVAQHTGNNSRGKALWVLQGGPGASSTAMEDLMETMYTELRGKVSVYTMDHRGTARSHRLECQAAGGQTPGSPGGTLVVLEEAPDCIRDILFQIDNQTAAFSVTSAAMDLRTIIDHSLTDQDVFVYGLSYGTYLVERLIHVAPTSVKGFVMDGIVSESGASVEERSTYSNWDYDVGMVGARFFGYCEQDAFCNGQFPIRTTNDSTRTTTTPSGHITAFVKELYARLDTNATDSSIAKCAHALTRSGKRPSFFLRSTFSDLLMDADARIVIPAIVARASRCSDEDAMALQHFVNAWTQSSEEDGTVDLDDVLFTSQMLYSVIVFSELWEYPSPTKQQLLQWYEDSTMGSDNYAALPYYCLFTGSREPACKALTHLPSNSPSMRYERDAFWNSTATLPPQATALLLSGGLDLQTRRMYGDLEYELLRGGDRMLVHFDYAGHCTTFTTPTKAGGATCGVRILASYVENDGDVARVDTSCVGDVYGLDFQTSSKFDLAYGYFGTKDLYV